MSRSRRTRLAKGELPLKPEEFDLASSLTEIVELTRLGVPDRSVGLELEPLALVYAGPVRLKQVVNNLLDNALKYSPPGTPIDVSLLFIAPEHLQPTVRDHGIGIPAEERVRVFERYHRAHRGFRGRSLGLSICAEIIRRHGGEIAAEAPTEGSGTQMVVRLPTGALRVIAAVSCFPPD